MQGMAFRNQGFRLRFGGAALIAAAALAVSMPVIAAPSISPENAGEKRDAIREAASKHEKKEKWDAMADSLESDALILGDPITLLESVDARLKYAEAEQDVEACNQAIETTYVALDILHFYDAVSTGSASSRWLVIDPDLAGDLIGDAEAKITRAEELIEEIERGPEETEDGAAVASAPGAKPKREKKKRGPAKPGTGLIAGGAAAAAIGVAGLGVGFAGLATGASKQKEVEELMVPEMQDEVDKLDEEGKRANTMGIVGLAIGGGALAVGTALIVVGVMKRKKAGNVPASASVRVAPVFAGHTNGVAVQGRF